MTAGSPRIVNSISYVTRINDEGDFSWQAQYLVTIVARRIVNNVSCVKKINHDFHSSWQAQSWVRLNNDSCCYAHCR